MADLLHPSAASRLPFIDALKALACQLIVLHHLAFYGPMSDHAYPLAPALISWLSQNARMAVQAFLVIAGFLAVRSLAPAGVMLSQRPLQLLRKRYVKLALPYLAALLIGIACAAMARALMVHDSIPGRPTLPQVMAHALLLQNILGYDGLSAGVWYIAIDFQLFALLVGILWLARRQRSRRCCRPCRRRLPGGDSGAAVALSLQPRWGLGQLGRLLLRRLRARCIVSYWASCQQRGGRVVARGGLPWLHRRVGARLPAPHRGRVRGGADARPGPTQRCSRDAGRSRA
jgi:peptidoglycan/LPS O-acetylase OafA/YrhL